MRVIPLMFLFLFLLISFCIVELGLENAPDEGSTKSVYVHLARVCSTKEGCSREARFDCQEVCSLNGMAHTALNNTYCTHSHTRIHTLTYIKKQN